MHQGFRYANLEIIQTRRMSCLVKLFYNFHKECNKIIFQAKQSIKPAAEHTFLLHWHILQISKNDYKYETLVLRGKKVLRSHEPFFSFL